MFQSSLSSSTTSSSTFRANENKTDIEVEKKKEGGKGKGEGRDRTSSIEFSVPALPANWIVTDNEAVRTYCQKIYKEKIHLVKRTFQYFDRVNKEDGSPLQQILLHLHLLRNYKPTILYPNGLIEFLKQKVTKSGTSGSSEGIQMINQLLNNKTTCKKGVAPQAKISINGYHKVRRYYQMNSRYNMCKFILLLINTGAGKTLVDWTINFLLKDGMLYWPSLVPIVNEKYPFFNGSHSPLLRGSLPIMLVLSQSVTILNRDFLPQLRKRHPYLHPECFQLLTSTNAKRENRGLWLKHKIEEIKANKWGEGIYCLATTPKLFTVELAKYFGLVKKKKKDLISENKEKEEEEEQQDVDYAQNQNLVDKETQLKTIWPFLLNIRLFILDEVDGLGTMSMCRRNGFFSSVKSSSQATEIITNFRQNPGSQVLAVSFLCNWMKTHFAEKHLIVGLTATAATGSAQKALYNYVALAGGFPGRTQEEKKESIFTLSQLVEDWKKHCIISYIAPQISPLEIKLHRCNVSPLTLEFHDMLIEQLLHQVDTLEQKSQEMEEDEDNEAKKEVDKKIKNLELILMNSCYNISLGLDIALSPVFKIREWVENQDVFATIYPKLMNEVKNEENAISAKSVELALDHLFNREGSKIIIFYVRRPQAESIRKLLVNKINSYMRKQNKTNKKYEKANYKIKNVLIYCGGNTRYEGAKYKGEEARQKFEGKLIRKDRLLNRILLMSIKCGRGQNFGLADYAIFTGLGFEHNSVVQALGRILRPNFENSKIIHFIVPQKELVSSEVCMGLLLQRICDMPTLQNEQMWEPIQKITRELFKGLDMKEGKYEDKQSEEEKEEEGGGKETTRKSKKNHHNRRLELASLAYENVRECWKAKKEARPANIQETTDINAVEKNKNKDVDIKIKSNCHQNEKVEESVWEKEDINTYSNNTNKQINMDSNQGVSRIEYIEQNTQKSIHMTERKIETEKKKTSQLKRLKKKIKSVTITTPSVPCISFSSSTSSLSFSSSASNVSCHSLSKEELKINQSQIIEKEAEASLPSSSLASSSSSSLVIQETKKDANEKTDVKQDIKQKVECRQMQMEKEKQKEKEIQPVKEKNKPLFSPEKKIEKGIPNMDIEVQELEPRPLTEDIHEIKQNTTEKSFLMNLNNFSSNANNMVPSSQKKTNLPLKTKSTLKKGNVHSFSVITNYFFSSDNNKDKDKNGNKIQSKEKEQDSGRVKKKESQIKPESGLSDPKSKKRKMIDLDPASEKRKKQIKKRKSNKTKVKTKTKKKKRNNRFVLLEAEEEDNKNGMFDENSDEYDMEDDLSESDKAFIASENDEGQENRELETVEDQISNYSIFQE